MTHRRSLLLVLILSIGAIAGATDNTNPPAPAPAPAPPASPPPPTTPQPGPNSIRPFIQSKLDAPPDEKAGTCTAAAKGTLQDVGDINTRCEVSWSNDQRHVVGRFFDKTPYSTISGHWDSCSHKSVHRNRINLSNHLIDTKVLVDHCGAVTITLDVPADLKCKQQGQQWICQARLPDVDCKADTKGPQGSGTGTIGAGTTTPKKGSDKGAGTGKGHAGTGANITTPGTPHTVPSSMYGVGTSTSNNTADTSSHNKGYMSSGKESTTNDTNSSSSGGPSRSANNDSNKGRCKNKNVVNTDTSSSSGGGSNNASGAVNTSSGNACVGNDCQKSSSKSSGSTDSSHSTSSSTGVGLGAGSSDSSGSSSNNNNNNGSNTISNDTSNSVSSSNSESNNTQGGSSSGQTYHHTNSEGKPCDKDGNVIQGAVDVKSSDAGVKVDANANIDGLYADAPSVSAKVRRALLQKRGEIPPSRSPTQNKHYFQAR